MPEFSANALIQKWRIALDSALDDDVLEVSPAEQHWPVLAHSIPTELRMVFATDPINWLSKLQRSTSKQALDKGTIGQSIGCSRTRGAGCLGLRKPIRNDTPK